MSTHTPGPTEELMIHCFGCDGYGGPDEGPTNFKACPGVQDTRPLIRSLVAVLEDAYELFRLGESSAIAYESGSLSQCNEYHRDAERIKERMDTAIARAAGKEKP